MSESRKEAMVITEKVLRRFWAKVQKSQDTNECWLWTAGLAGGRNTYGILRIGDKVWRANRVSWTITNGPIPEGLYVLHRCPGKDNKRCVNPTHLYLGTEADNGRDRAARKQMCPCPGEKNGSAKITDEQTSEVPALYASGQTMPQIAAYLGITSTRVGQILKRTRGRAWIRMQHGRRKKLMGGN